MRLREPEVSLGAATEAAPRSTAGGMTIYQVMIGERAKVHDGACVFIQRLMDAYGSGLLIMAIGWGILMTFNLLTLHIQT